MIYLGQQHLVLLQNSGWDAIIHTGYRSPEEQDAAHERGVSKAHAFRSPHQYFEAVDIVHKTLFWDPPPAFWDDLNAASQVIERKFKVSLTCGYNWGWDMAHVELKDWHDFRDKIGKRVPTQAELDTRFKEVLPDVWKRHVQSKSYQGRSAPEADTDVRRNVASIVAKHDH